MTPAARDALATPPVGYPGTPAAWRNVLSNLRREYATLSFAVRNFGAVPSRSEDAYVAHRIGELCRWNHWEMPPTAARGDDHG